MQNMKWINFDYLLILQEENQMFYMIVKNDFLS